MFNLPSRIKKSSSKLADKQESVDSSAQKLIASLTSVKNIDAKVKFGRKGAGQFDVIMTFDTTCSMFPYFDQVRQNLRQIAETICQKVRNTRFAVIPYKNHNDVDYFDGEVAFLKSQLTTEIEEIRQQIMTVKSGGGGPDWLTVLEDVFHYINCDIQWSLATSKVLIIVGDEPPHGVKDSKEACPFGYDYEREIAALIKKGVKIYPVLCGCDKATALAFKSFASQSEGVFLELGQIDDLVDLIIGICFKEINPQLFKDFRLDLSKRGQLPESKKKLFLLLEDHSDK